MMKRFALNIAGLAAIWALPLAAQETRIGGEGFKSPVADLSQLDWLVGQWAGEGIEGAPAIESWLPPTGATMVGTFVQQTPVKDDKSTIMFTEHMYIVEQEGSLTLKLKHFNADLTGWEDKDGMVTFPLVAIEPCAAYFNGLTLRCADPDNPGAGIVAAVRMKDGAGADPAELSFRFKRLPSPDKNVCSDAANTLELNDCFGDLLKAADTRRANYFEAAIARTTEDHELTENTATDGTDVITQMRASEAAFVAYRDAECGAVYEAWKEGSIRGVMDLTCKIKLTDERTRTIWQNWLTYMDSTPPVLPEPEPTL